MKHETQKAGQSKPSERKSPETVFWYIKAPIWALCLPVSSRARIVYLALLGWKGKKESCNPHEDTIAARCGMKLRCVQRAVRELVEARMVSTTYERRKGNVYTFDNEELADRKAAWTEWELERRKHGSRKRASSGAKQGSNPRSSPTKIGRSTQSSPTQIGRSTPVVDLPKLVGAPGSKSVTANPLAGTEPAKSQRRKVNQVKEKKDTPGDSLKKHSAFSESSRVGQPAKQHAGCRGAGKRPPAPRGKFKESGKDPAFRPASGAHEGGAPPRASGSTASRRSARTTLAHAEGAAAGSRSRSAGTPTHRPGENGDGIRCEDIE